MLGKIPGFMSPTANINVTLGCAMTVWVYYHLQGVKAQGIVAYVKHFAVPPGAPIWTRAADAHHRDHQPPLARAVALAATVRQHLR